MFLSRNLSTSVRLNILLPLFPSKKKFSGNISLLKNNNTTKNVEHIISVFSKFPMFNQSQNELISVFFISLTFNKSKFIYCLIFVNSKSSRMLSEIFSFNFICFIIKSLTIFFEFGYLCPNGTFPHFGHFSYQLYNTSLCILLKFSDLLINKILNFN